MKGCRGFTLWEFVWVLGIVAVLSAISTPSLRELTLDGRRIADINAFVTAIQLARSEAAKRGRPVVLCKSADSLSCGGAEIRYDAGWLVFVNVDDRRPPQIDPGDHALHAYDPATNGSITSNRRLFEFRPFGWRSTNGTVTFCDERGPNGARAVIVSYTGRPRVSARGPGNRGLGCADFP